MFGEVTINGLPWQGEASTTLPPGSYSHSHIICRKHHRELNGLDGIALGYFKNFMLLSGENHIASGVRGSLEDMTPVIDGRSLEKWFMKTLCGFVAGKSVNGFREVQLRWVEGLFAKIPWPDEWSVYIKLGDWKVMSADSAFHIDFMGEPGRMLTDIVIKAYAVETLFSLIPLDESRNSDLARRPEGLRLAIKRPDGGDILDGIPEGQHVQIDFNWD